MDVSCDPGLPSRQSRPRCHPTSRFSKWLHREPTDRERRRTDLNTRVSELFAASKHRYGSRVSTPTCSTRAGRSV